MGVRVSSSSHIFFDFFAEIAQLVEHNLAKVGVAGPSPVFRSSIFLGKHTRSNESVLKIF